VPALRGISKTFKSMPFNWRRYVLKEYNTFFVWLGGIALLLLFNYPQLTNFDAQLRNLLLFTIFPSILASYLIVRFLKKSRRLAE
jgi:hypothetical protein